jgi:hypothetical protein
VAIRLAIAAAVIAGVTIPLISAGNTISSVHIPTLPPILPGGVNTQPAPVPTHGPSRPASYLTVAGVRAGLARVAALVPRARLALVRLDARSLAASAALPGGAFKEVVLAPTGAFVTTGASSGQRLVSISQIKPRAVARIVTAMRRRFHVRADQIDYLVLSSPPGVSTRWIVFAKAPGHPGFSATLAGAGLTRLPG